MTDNPQWGQQQPGWQPPGWQPPGAQQPGWQPPGGQPPGWQPQGPGYGQQGYGPYGGWPPAAPAPGGVPLRPLGAGDILSGAFTLIRRNPVTTLGVAAVVETISGVVSTVISRIEQTGFGRVEHLAPGATPAQVRAAFGGFLGSFVPGLAASVVLSILFAGILTGMLTGALGRGLLGEKISVAQAWQGARVLPVIGVSLLVPLILIVMWIPLVVLVVLLAVAKFTAAAVVLGILGWIGMGLLTIFVVVRLFVAVPVVVLEGAGPWNALRRSWQLIQGNWWRTFGIYLLALLVVGIIGLVLQVPFLILEVVLTGGSGGGGPFPFSPAVSAPGLGILLIGAIGGIIAATCTKPISSGVTVLLYADLRMRKEGLDLALQQAGQAPALTNQQFTRTWLRDQPPATPGAPPT